MGELIGKHGGFRTLLSFQMATLVYDLTVIFCRNYIDQKSRTVDQMVQAARSGRQNIAEGCQASGTSKKTEIKLVNVARASLEELLLDYEDFLRQNGLKLWDKDNNLSIGVRQISRQTNKSYKSYLTYMTNKEKAANCLICMIHQTNYLLDRQLRALEKEVLKEGGFTEQMYKLRKRSGSF